MESKSFFRALKAAAMKAIFPRMYALNTAKAMMARNKGIRAANLSLRRAKMGRSFFSFFFFLPRPGITIYKLEGKKQLIL